MRKLVIMTILTMGMTMLANAEYVTSENGLRLRAEPSLEAEVLRVVPFAEEVTGTIKNGWLETADGFLKAEYLSETNPLDGYDYMGTWMMTAYTHTGNCCFDGSYPEAGYTVACNSLPIGTVVYISGIGTRTVCDRGPQSMPGEWMDLFVDSYQEAVIFGMQHHDVWVKETP